jgi:hypothetical protein
VTRRAGGTLIGAAMLIGLSVSSAQAGYVVTLEQVGSNVVATGSGAIDLTGLSFQGNTTNGGGVNPSFADISTGPPSPVTTSIFQGFIGPKSFGGGGTTFANSGSGDLVDLLGADNLLFVPEGYVSDNPLSDTSTYDNQTFASLGATPGTYEWTWGTGPNQNVTLNIEALGAPIPIPEPSSVLLFALSFGLVMLLAARCGWANG